MNLNEVNFEVPLSGSQLFDMHTKATAINLVGMFPGLDYRIDYDNKKIVIFGELNDYWYGEWHKAIFNIGEIRA